MKKTSLFLFFVLLGSYSFSQTLKLSDMIEKTKCQNISCYNNYILLNGFSFTSLDSNYSGDKTYYYHSDNFYDTVGAMVYKSQCLFMILNGSYVEYTFITYITRQKRNYLPLLKQLKAEGFKAVEENGNAVGKQRIKTKYKSVKHKFYEITISINPDINEDGLHYSTYNVTVARIKDKVKKN